MGKIIGNTITTPYSQISNVKDIFTVYIRYTGSGLSSDKTRTEIKEAYDAGKTIVATNGEFFMNLVEAYPMGKDFTFSCVIGYTLIQWRIHSDDNGSDVITESWNTTELLSNKTENMIDNTEKINHSNYPTTQAVTDYVDFTLVSWGGGTDMFIVHITYTGAGTAICDKTATEITTAYNEGKIIIVTDGTIVANMIEAYPIDKEFGFTYADRVYSNLWYISDNGDNGAIVTISLRELERVDNKSTEMLYDELINHTTYPTTLAVKDYVDNTVSNQVNSQISSLKPTIIYSVTNNTLTLKSNQRAILGDISTLILSVPSLSTSQYATYESEFCFKSGETATTLTYPASSIIWRGDDCDEYGDFVPEPNTNYEISVRAIGTEFVARVGAY